jgi:hypothetical protein
MPTILHSSFSERKILFTSIEAAARNGETLQAVAQGCAEDVYSRYRDSLVLLRIYATVPYAETPQRVQQFARGITDAQGVTEMLQPGSIVLALLGTAGLEADWNDRLRSQGHLGIPLVNSDFVANLPMVASLMKDMGFGLEWLDRQDSSIVVKEVGRLARVFFVPDARTTVDSQGRKVVPASDFVDANGVRTVFGLGGAYLDGTFLAMIFFTREVLEKQQVEAFLPALNMLKLGTMKLVIAHKIFE